MDVLEIQKLLPHRYPFVMIDRVSELVPWKRMVAYKNVSINEPFFQGHFPGRPIMPGVLIIEAMAQTAALLAYASAPTDLIGNVAYLAAIDNVRFRKPVVPGDRLVLKIEVLKHKGGYWKWGGTALVDDQVVAEAELLATLGPRQE